MLEALRKRMAEIAALLLAISTSADGAKRNLTKEETEKVETLSVEFDNIQREVAARERILRVTGVANESAGRQTEPGGGAAAGNARGSMSLPRNRLALRTGDTNGFNSLAEFGVSVRNASMSQLANIDPRLSSLRAPKPDGVQAAPTGFHQEGSSADLGFLVPADFRADIWDLVFNGTDLVNMVAIEPTVSNAVEMGADETTPWGSSGVKAKWRAEASQMTPTGNATVDPRVVRLHELFAFVTATDELMQDAPRLENRLTVKAAQAIQWEASEALMNGNGVGRPLGWMKAPSLITVAKETGQATKTVVRQNILNMFIRLLAMGATAPRWIMNRDVLPALAEMSLGNNGLFLLPSTGLIGAPNGQILGIPIEYSEHCKTLGTAGDIQLADLLGYYAIGKTGGVKFDSSIHLFFDYNLTAFRWTFRLGGQPFLSAAVTPANGTNSRSHFVTLADRP